MRDGFMNRYSIVKDGKTITLVPLSPTKVYEYQMKSKKESEVEGKENTSEEYGERRQLDLATNETNMNSFKSEGKIRGEKKVRVRERIVWKN
jgi:hypothetical protein